MSEDSILVAKTTVSFELPGGGRRVIKAGSTIRVGHPLLKGRERYFAPLKVDYDYSPAESGKHSARKTEK